MECGFCNLRHFRITVEDLKKNIAFDTNQDGTVEEDEAKVSLLPSIEPL